MNNGVVCRLTFPRAGTLLCWSVIESFQTHTVYFVDWSLLFINLFSRMDVSAALLKVSVHISVLICISMKASQQIRKMGRCAALLKVSVRISVLICISLKASLQIRTMGRCVSLKTRTDNHIELDDTGGKKKTLNHLAVK